MIESDHRLKKTLAEIEARRSPPVNRMVREALDKLREAPAPAPNSSSIIKARALLSNSRSVLVANRIILLREHSLLSNARKNLASYLLAKYTNHLNSVKNSHSREAMINNALAKLDTRINSLQSGIEAINAVIADYDSKAYGIRDTIAAIQLGEREI